MKIRLMKIEDSNLVYLLWKEAGLDVVDYKTEKEDMEQIIKLNPYTNFVICEKEKIVGAVLGAFNGRRAWVYHLAIYPFFQNKGLGALLLHKTEEALKKSGAKKVQLFVSKTNLKVIGFYKKQGYRQLDEVIPFGKSLPAAPIIKVEGTNEGERIYL